MKKYVVRQNELMDCGACCLGSVVKYYNGYVPLEIIKIDTFTNKEGTTFFNLKQAAIKYGFEVKGYQNNTLTDYQLPLIVQLKTEQTYHFVVLYKIIDKYICMDPAYGITKYSQTEFRQLFTGYSLELIPIKTILKCRNASPFKQVLLNEYKSNKFKIIVLIILSIIILCVSFVVMLIFRMLLKEYNSSLLIFIILLTLIKFSLNYFKSNMVSHLNKNISYNLLVNFINHIFNLPLKYLQLKNAGDTINKINKIYELKEYLISIIINVFINSIMIIFSLVLLYNINAVLSIILLFICILLYLLYNKFSKKLVIKYNDLVSFENNLVNNIIEKVNKILNVKTLRLESYFLKQIKGMINFNLDKDYKINYKINLLNNILNIYSEIILLFIIIYGSLNHLSIIDILTYYFIFNYFNNSFMYILNLNPILSHLKAIYYQISDLYYIKEENFTDGFKVLDNDIQIKNLSYKINLYNYYNKLNVYIKSGSKVLILGESGSGKTTLLNIIYNNIDYYNGTIKIGNIDTKNININSYYKIVGYVTQNDELYNDTVLNNIILNYSYNQNKLNIIIKLLYLDLIITKKLKGINTLVKDNFSGGEQQRIILARALYRNYKVLLLDEALSEVSKDLKSNIIQNINEYYINTTIIFVSHQQEEYCYDKVIYLTARKDNEC